MLYQKNTYSDNTVIAIWKTNETVSELRKIFPNYGKNLPDFGKTEKRQKECLAARILVENVCGTDKSIVYNENGKPFLSDNSFQISISHTADYVALIAHPTKEVGIDIEKNGEKVQRVKERFLAAEELQHIDKQNETTHLLLHWCAKETMYKMLNRTNVDFAKDLCILPFSPKENGVLSCHCGLELVDNCHCGLDPQSPEYTLSYSVEKDFTMVWGIK
ncbi:siderophore biosynthesis protein [Bacteroidia bacterium]|nr:siderophore biosynthesis protein [Bacteroidia bacterium]